MRTFKNSLLADEDIINAFEYGIEKWDIEQALKYKQELEKGRNRICENPHLAGCKKRDELVEGCLSYRVNKHHFFYKVSEDDSTILIARILHGTREFSLHVKPSYFPNPDED